MSNTCMHNFWKACLKESATNDDIEEDWKHGGHQIIEECLRWADQKWMKHPMITNSEISIEDARIKQKC